MFKHLRKHEDPLVAELRRTKAIPKKVLRQMVEFAQINHRGVGYELAYWAHIPSDEILSIAKVAYSKRPFSSSHDLFVYEIIAQFPKHLAIKYRCFPLVVVETGCLIAMASPPEQACIDELEGALDSVVHVVQAPEAEILDAIEIWRDRFQPFGAPAPPTPLGRRPNDSGSSAPARSRAA